MPFATATQSRSPPRTAPTPLQRFEIVGQEKRQIESPGCPITANGVFGFWGHDDRGDEAWEKLAPAHRVRLQDAEQVVEVAGDGRGARVKSSRLQLRRYYPNDSGRACHTDRPRARQRKGNRDCRCHSSSVSAATLRRPSSQNQARAASSRDRPRRACA